MTKPKILLQFDSDTHASVFDAVVAIDAGVDQLLQYGGIELTQVRDLTHGAMFTRGPQDLHQTAIFIGGSNVTRGEELLAAVKDCFFGPMRVSVLLDANGANTTAAAAVIAAARHLNLAETTATVLAATGPVGQRVARLLAGQGASVKLASRSVDRAADVCETIRKKLPQANLAALQTSNSSEVQSAIAGSQLVIAAGAAGVELMSHENLNAANSLKVAIDLNAVPPVGIAGIDAGDKAADRAGVICYGAFGVGGTKMKIHRAAIQQLFTANSLVLDAEEIFSLGQQLQ
ncbi:NAD(P)-dependent methylenetetrahydromethanopterin dehydrogenase [Anatilimnocola floriformis]|uniref:NAD(P)-dependent methylenetetrahydromethanopterin dehydrogenase n=1 Tax=Anatilimnocola floriformis TaxID=2948575 RepID=UPI0020C54358|nr:NAD(P)-dependent methylenetetrahydromethanopterin dehydrogenase [Anatilimnocola floriformis]